jgi:hypothetical protein
MFQGKPHSDNTYYSPYYSIDEMESFTCQTGHRNHGKKKTIKAAKNETRILNFS